MSKTKKPQAPPRGRWVSFAYIARDLGIARLTARKRVEDGTIPGGKTFLGKLRVCRETYVKWRPSVQI